MQIIITRRIKPSNYINLSIIANLILTNNGRHLVNFGKIDKQLQWNANRARANIVSDDSDYTTLQPPVDSAIPLYSSSRARYIGGVTPEIYAVVLGAPGKKGITAAVNRSRSIQKAARPKNGTSSSSAPHEDL